MPNYPYLPVGQEIRHVSADHPHLLAAKAASDELSTDQLHPTGAVIVKAGRVIVREANQAGLRHPRWRDYHRRGWCLRRLLGVKSGEKYWLCPGCATPADHAEARAVRAAAATGLDLTDAELYLWGHWWCCRDCWEAMLAVGLTRVYLLAGGEERFR